jgi:hypothetical protein
MLDGRLKEYNNHYYVKKEELYKAPYHQDSKLLSSPCFNTTHIDTFTPFYISNADYKFLVNVFYILFIQKLKYFFYKKNIIYQKLNPIKTNPQAPTTLTKYPK